MCIYNVKQYPLSALQIKIYIAAALKKEILDWQLNRSIIFHRQYSLGKFTGALHMDSIPVNSTTFYYFLEECENSVLITIQQINVIKNPTELKNTTHGKYYNIFITMHH